MKAKTETKVSVRCMIEAMEIGEEKLFDIAMLSNIRAYASNAGLRLGRKYSTITDRDNMKIKVIREL